MALVTLYFLSSSFLSAAETSEVAVVSTESDDDGITLNFIPQSEVFTFEPDEERRDILYDYESILSVEKQIRDSEERESATEQIQQVVDLEVIKDGIDPDQIKELAERYVEEAQQLVKTRQYDAAVRKVDEGVKKLSRVYDESKKEPQAVHERFAWIPGIVEKLSRFKVQAEEARLYDEAKQEFIKKAFKIEGVMWSAEEGGRSLAIISGKIYGIQDRLKDCLIVNIDVNRVDFMFTYKNRRFEFQRYRDSGE